MTARRNPVIEVEDYQAVHYLNVVSAGALIIVRVPYPMPIWRFLQKALTPIMREHSLRKKDVSMIDGLLPFPDASWSSEDKSDAVRLDRAFAGDKTCLYKFWLYDWNGSSFTVVRGPVDKGDGS